MQRSFTVEMAAFHWSFPNWPVHITIGTLLYGQPCPCYALIWKPMILLGLRTRTRTTVGGGLQNCSGGHYVTPQ